MPQVYRSQSNGSDSYTRPGSNAEPGVTWPAPKSSGVALPPARWIGLPWLSSWLAVVISADLIAVGDQVGFLLLISAAIPEMCGVAMEVPDSRSKSWPLCPGGATAASTSTPGALMSGLSRSPPLLTDGPIDEKSAMTGASFFTAVAAEIAAVGFAVPAMYALMAAPSVGPTWIDGTKWKSALSELAVGLYWIMPTPPACWTALLLSTRATTPRLQST